MIISVLVLFFIFIRRINNKEIINSIFFISPIYFFFVIYYIGICGVTILACTKYDWGGEDINTRHIIPVLWTQIFFVLLLVLKTFRNFHITKYVTKMVCFYFFVIFVLFVAANIKNDINILQKKNNHYVFYRDVLDFKKIVNKNQIVFTPRQMGFRLVSLIDQPLIAFEGDFYTSHKYKPTYDDLLTTQKQGNFWGFLIDTNYNCAQIENGKLRNYVEKVINGDPEFKNLYETIPISAYLIAYRYIGEEGSPILNESN